MINQNKINSMAATGELEQCVASGQVSAAQIEAHRAAGELGKSAIRKAFDFAHDTYVADTSKLNPFSNAFHKYSTTALSILPSLIAEHDAQITQLTAELAAARDANAGLTKQLAALSELAADLMHTPTKKQSK